MHLLQNYRKQFAYYRHLGEGAMAQLTAQIMLEGGVGVSIHPPRRIGGVQYTQVRRGVGGASLNRPPKYIP